MTVILSLLTIITINGEHGSCLLVTNTCTNSEERAQTGKLRLEISDWRTRNGELELRSSNQRAWTRELGVTSSN